jgi:hypothetical protein
VLDGAGTKNNPRASIESLEHQLEAEREANREDRRLLAAALDRIPLQLEAPAEPLQKVEEGPGDAQHHPETRGEAHEGVQQRPWWRRMFGG